MAKPTMKSIRPQDLRIAVLGLGHVGLPTALGLAELGWPVIGADSDVDKVQAIAAGGVPFYETGVEESLARQLESETLVVEPDVSAAIRAANVIFVCVNTPQHPDGSADLSYLERVARDIASNHNGYKLVVEKSTTPVQTAQRIKESIGRYLKGNGSDVAEPIEDSFEVSVNPEFLQEGTALRDFLKPDRVVIGVESDRASEILRTIYQPLLERNETTADEMLVVTDINTAEIIKHASNSFLAAKISFINMVSDLCEATGANVEDVAKGLGLDPRIGPQFLHAGIGYGGYCLPKDIRAFTWIASEHGADFSLLAEVDRVNEQRVGRLLDKLRKALWVVKDKTVAVWGLSFKPETDDVRESPSLRVVAGLLDEGANLRLYDPVAMDQFKLEYPEDPTRVTYCESAEDAADDTEAVLIATDWKPFLSVDLDKVKERMKVPLIVDGRNLFEPDEVRAKGFEYHSVGRP